MDPTTLFAVDTFVVAAALLATQGFKSLLELVIPSTDARHDIIIRMFAVLVGIVGILIDRGQPSTADGHAWIVLVVAGALSGLSATGFYHLMSGSPGTVQIAPITGTLVSSEAIAPSPTDLAAAVVTALQPALARLVPPAYNFPASILPQPATPPVTAQVTTSDGVGVKTDTVIIPASLGNLVPPPSPTVTAGEVSPKPA